MCVTLPLAGVGWRLLSSEGSDPGLTPRRYYFSVRARWPKSCQHIFYPSIRTVYFPLPPSSLCSPRRSSCLLCLCVHSRGVDPTQGPLNILNHYPAELNIMKRYFFLYIQTRQDMMLLKISSAFLFSSFKDELLQKKAVNCF